MTTRRWKSFVSVAAAIAAIILTGSFGSVSTSRLSAADSSKIRPGYYREPAIHGDTIIFTAEGDLWTVGVKGGLARRLTSNPGREGGPVISPDGSTVAFSAEYEGPREVYTMPVEGGLPQRRTWDGDASAVGWMPDGRLLIRTRRYSTLPDSQLVAIDSTGKRELLPLAEGSEAAFTPDGHTLFFTRYDPQPSHTKRYKGGTAESIWRYEQGSEAVPLTSDYAGTSHDPMFWDGRVYFISDRDGVMNIYSMDRDGHGLKQHTHQHGFDIQWASLSDGRIVYQCGADLWLLNIKSGQDAVINITLVSDFDQLRDHWVKRPLEYLSAVHISPDGDAAVFTARGEVFTAPARSGRLVKVAGNSSIRFREARYMPDGKSIVVLSTESGETEFWKYPANGEGTPEQWTHDAKVLRWEGVPSPDGRWLAHRDKDQQLWLFDIKNKQQKLIAKSMLGNFENLTWSPDSQWLAFVQTADNTFDQIKVVNVNTGAIHELTSDHYNSSSPAWSADGKWLYFISDRMLRTVVFSPWGARQPDPFFDRSMKIYELALTPGQRSPFAPADELHPDQPGRPEPKPPEPKSDQSTEAKPEKPAEAKKPAAVTVNIDFNDLAPRLSEVPVPPGNYSDLQAAQKRLCWVNRDEGAPPKFNLMCTDIANKGDPPDTVMTDVRDYEISLDRKKMLARKGEEFYILDADAKGAATTDPKSLAKARIDLSHWMFDTNPRGEFHELFIDAWRLERDYFYDRHMNGVNWIAMRDRYLPLVDRVTDRDDLNDVIAQMVSELSALHTFVRGGDSRGPSDEVGLASLGAVLKRDEQAGGYLVQHVYIHDPDLPNEAPPLARPDSMVREGEVILSIDGDDLLGVSDERALLRGKAGRQVLLRVKSSSGQVREVVTTPISAMEERNLRYNEWEYTRRVKVDADSKGRIGYVHLRAMGSGDIEQWAREYYPVFDRQGLILDVRHNNGGSIDSWLLGKLLRRAWFWWQPRVGNPSENMQYAFTGHMVVLCDRQTASDGEAFAEGFRRLGLGKLIGLRTWGGEIWLSSSNVLADRGIATAAEMGVYGPEGKWLIEGHGVDPDMVVDNLPHSTFTGSDAQLDAAIKYLEEQIRLDPRPVPKPPGYPDKSFDYDKK